MPNAPADTYHTIKADSAMAFDAALNAFVALKWEPCGSTTVAVHFQPAGGGKGAYTPPVRTELWAVTIRWNRLMGEPKWLVAPEEVKQ